MMPQGVRKRRRRMGELDEMDRRILAFLEEHFRTHRTPPTVREIQHAVRASSTSVVNYHLKHLEEAGRIVRHAHRARGIQLVQAHAPGVRYVPVLGTIAAGTPRAAFPEDWAYADETIPVPEGWLAADPERIFALRVQGQSMRDAAIEDGDVIIVERIEDPSRVRNGEMVVAWVEPEDEATVKYYYLEGDQVRLQPANPDYPVIRLPRDQVWPQGRVIGVLRHVRRMPLDET